MEGFTKFCITTFGISAIAIPSMIYISILDDDGHEKKVQESEKRITGEVLKESYENTLSPQEKWEGAVSYSNETVKLDSKYTLQVRRDDTGEVIGLSVVDGDSVTKESLDMLIDKGSGISFPKGNLKPNMSRLSRFALHEETYFKPDTQAGTKRADRIRVYERKRR